jgi:hypothetical protein
MLLLEAFILAFLNNNVYLDCKVYQNFSLLQKGPLETHLKGHWRRASGASQMLRLAFVGQSRWASRHISDCCVKKQKKRMTSSRHSRRTTSVAIRRWPSMCQWPSDRAPVRRREEERDTYKLKNKGRAWCRPWWQDLHAASPDLRVAAVASPVRHRPTGPACHTTGPAHHAAAPLVLCVALRCPVPRWSSKRQPPRPC